MLRTFAALVWWAPSAPEGRGGWGSGLDKHGLWLGAVIAVSVPAAAGVLSMVFPWRARQLQGFEVANSKDHAYQICCRRGAVVPGGGRR